MYSNKLVTCIKADGKVLREKGDVVLLPFSSEYSLYFKNEHSRKVQITVEIDGQDVMNGKSLLLDAGDNLDLNGFVNDVEGNDNRAFKFITKTNEISDFRDDRPEDGLIKVYYTFEQDKPTLRYKPNDVIFGDTRSYTNCGDNKYPVGGAIKDVDLDSFDTNNSEFFGTSNVKVDSYMPNTTINSVTSQPLRSMDFGMTTAPASIVNTPSEDPGITVEGSNTGQSFQRGSIGILESESHTMVFQLKGLTSEEVVREPVTVKTKKQCPSCGKKYKSSFEYCSQDGTFLR